MLARRLYFFFGTVSVQILDQFFKFLLFIFWLLSSKNFFSALAR